MHKNMAFKALISPTILYIKPIYKRIKRRRNRDIWTLITSLQDFFEYNKEKNVHVSSRICGGFFYPFLFYISLDKPFFL